MSNLYMPTSIATDPRLRAAAERAGVPMATALAVWVAMVCNASEEGRDGALADWFNDVMPVSLGVLEGQIAALRVAMQGSLLDGAKVIGLARYLRPEWPIDVDMVRWAELRTEIFRRDDFTCRYCGRRGGKLECDHVVPLSRGGTSAPENLVTACLPCNRSKGAKRLDEWRAS